MRRSFFKNIPVIALILVVFFASVGFMTIIESRCTMTENDNTDTCSMMGCCETQSPVEDGGPSFVSASNCHTTTLAGLPSTLLSTTAPEQSTAKIDFSLHNFIPSLTPFSVINPKSEIGNLIASSPPHSSVERYILTSTLLI